MAKILKVTKPFFVMEIGDTFEYDANTKQYKSVYNIEHNGSDEKNTTVVSTYNSVYTISEEYAKMLIDNGYLEESYIDTESEKPTQFVNIFNEIDKLEKTKIDTKNFSLTYDNYQPWAWALLIVVMLNVVMQYTVLRRIP